MQLSYAQNMEDMHLACLFDSEPEGFYIDVGGGHPVADNVSFRSYLRGWRGLVVEPQAALHRLYAGVRPRDLAIDLLVGKAKGTASFHAVDRLHGFSTMIEANARGAEGFGATFETEERQVTTLAALCEAHAPARIDWLKVDVEGAEVDVLLGADWGRFRPRVVLVEAIAPGTMEPSHAGWEPILTAAGYGFAFFDGLNRWYLAEEAGALAGRLPPAFLDWGGARHLYDHGRARERADHPDHALASALNGLDPAALPLVDEAALFGFLTKNLDPAQLAAPVDADTLERLAHLWLGAEPHGFDAGHASGRALGEALLLMTRSDAFRAALGRIAAAYDGGFIME